VTKSELITALLHQSHLGHRDVERAVSTLLDHMNQTLAHGRRIEIRGDGEGDRFSISAVSIRTEQP
jgi:integration host factor subunit beta